MGHIMICAFQIHNYSKHTKKIRWAGHLARTGKSVGEYSVGKL